MRDERDAAGHDPIRVKVRFFAAPRQALDTDQIELQVPDGTTVGELLDLLKREYPVLEAYVRFVSVAVNRAYVGMGTELQEGDEVACLPPVGGGSAGACASADRVKGSSGQCSEPMR